MEQRVVHSPIRAYTTTNEKESTTLNFGVQKQEIQEANSKNSKKEIRSIESSDSENEEGVVSS